MIGTSITSALKYLFQNRKPITIQSDMGIEFVNAPAEQYLKRQGLYLHTTQYPGINGAVIERFNIYLKTRMYIYFRINNTYSYLSVTDELLIGYNISIRYTISMPSINVNSSNINSAWQRMNSLWAKIPQQLQKLKWVI